MEKGKLTNTITFSLYGKNKRLKKLFNMLHNKSKYSTLDIERVAHLICNNNTCMRAEAVDIIRQYTDSFDKLDSQDKFKLSKYVSEVCNIEYDGISNDDGMNVIYSINDSIMRNISVIILLLMESTDEFHIKTLKGEYFKKTIDTNGPKMFFSDVRFCGVFCEFLIWVLKGISENGYIVKILEEIISKNSNIVHAPDFNNILANVNQVKDNIFRGVKVPSYEFSYIDIYGDRVYNKIIDEFDNTYVGNIDILNLDHVNHGDIFPEIDKVFMKEGRMDIRVIRRRSYMEEMLPFLEMISSIFCVRIEANTSFNLGIFDMGELKCLIDMDNDISEYSYTTSSETGGDDVLEKKLIKLYKLSDGVLCERDIHIMIGTIYTELTRALTQIERLAKRPKSIFANRDRGGVTYNMALAISKYFKIENDKIINIGAHDIISIIEYTKNTRHYPKNAIKLILYYEELARDILIPKETPKKDAKILKSVLDQVFDYAEKHKTIKVKSIDPEKYKDMPICEMISLLYDEDRMKKGTAKRLAKFIYARFVTMVEILDDIVNCESYDSLADTNISEKAFLKMFDNLTYSVFDPYGEEDLSDFNTMKMVDDVINERHDVQDIYDYQSGEITSEKCPEIDYIKPLLVKYADLIILICGDYKKDNTMRKKVKKVYETMLDLI